jgi:hypothetical protein
MRFIQRLQHVSYRRLDEGATAPRRRARRRRGMVILRRSARLQESVTAFDRGEELPHPNIACGLWCIRMAVPASAMPNMQPFGEREVARCGGDVAHVSHPYRNSSRGYSGDSAVCNGRPTRASPAPTRWSSDLKREGGSKKWDRAFERFPHRVGATNTAQPNPAHNEDLLKRVMPFPICNKQLKRQYEPLITTILGRFQIG